MGCRCNDTDDWDDDCNCGGDCESDYADDEQDDSTISCPNCGREVYEDSPRCPHCGEYISDEDTMPGRQMWLIIVGVILCLCAILAWFVNS